MVIRGRGGRPSAGAAGVNRFSDLHADTIVEFDENRFTADSAGALYTFAGSGTIKIKSPTSNEELPVTLWNSFYNPSSIPGDDTWQ